MDRMNPGRVRLGLTGSNGRKVKKDLVAAWCKLSKLRVLLTHLPVGADTACVHYAICLIGIQTIGVSLPV